MKTMSKQSTSSLAAAALVALCLSACGYPGAEEDRASAAGGAESTEQAEPEPETSPTPTEDADDQEPDDSDISDVIDDVSSDESEEPDDGENGSGDGLLDLPTINLIPADVEEDEVTVYVAAESGFSPTIARWVVHGDPAEGDLVGSEIEVSRWNCVGDVQVDSFGEIGSPEFGSGADVYDIEWLSGGNPQLGGGGPTQYNVTIEEQRLIGESEDSDRAATIRHDSALSQFGGMCGELADFVLP